MLFPRRFLILSTILIAALVSVSIVQGHWTNRWVSASAQETQEMEKLPMTVGAWDGTTLENDTAKQILDFSGNYLARRYVNHSDGTVVSMMLTRGRPGPMVIKHLPTECYESAGFELKGQPKRFLSESGQGHYDEFLVATFRKTTDVIPVTVRVYWSWSGNGKWQIPERPRVAFARYPVLYKVYIVQNLPNEDAAFEGAPAHDLIKELTSAMRGSIFPSSAR